MRISGTLFRRFFVTRKGSFDLGRTQMRDGDEIYLLPGARCPLVLRKHTVLGLNRIFHTVIGDCYLDVAMDGHYVVGFHFDAETLYLI